MDERYGFSVGWRNPGHWDVYGAGKRDFRIRGEAPKVVVFDERADRGADTLMFKTVATAMAWIADEYMVRGNATVSA